METSLFKQAAEFLRERQTMARALAIFLCLAVIVTAGTVGVLTSTGQAMTHQVKMLTCPLVIHRHTDECKDPETGELVCGYADYVVHVHNADCYGPDGSLVCTLEEEPPHEHDDDCWGEIRTLTCTLEEGPGHVHTDACYDRQRGKLICTQPEHTHVDACFIREYELTCDLTEVPHEHTDACYTVSRDLTCTLPEHTHTDACLDGTGAVICGMEEHVHGDGCYTENRTLTCDKTVDPHIHDPQTCYTLVSETNQCGIPEHTHTDDCYEIIETLTCTIPEGEGAHTHTDECYDISEGWTCGKLELHTHDDSCFAHDEEGNRIGRPICGKIELLEHVHGSECFTVEELSREELDALYGQEPAEGAETGDGVYFFTMETPEPEYICGLAEHTHSDSCYNKDEAGNPTGDPICGYAFEHVHDESCLPAPEPTPVPQASAYACGFTDHTHTDECYAKDETTGEITGDPICGLTEHVHDASCLAQPEIPAQPEESPAPEAALAPAYICGFTTEHTHTDDCYAKDETTGEPTGDPICGLAEHTHTEACLAPVEAAPEETPAPEYICGFTAEHTHTDECYAKDETTGEPTGDPICGLSEHTHTEACLAPVEAAPEEPVTQIWDDETVRITATYTAAAGLPENAKLQAEPLKAEADPAHYEQRLEATLDALGESGSAASNVFLYKIGFYADGVEVEPLAPVTVTVQFLDEQGFPVGTPVKIVHFDENGEVETLEGTPVDEANSTSFVTGGFSDFALHFTRVLRDNGTYGILPIAGGDGTGNLEDYIEGMKLQKKNPETGEWEDVPAGEDVVLGNNYRLYVTFKNDGSDKFQSEMHWNLGPNVTCTPKNGAPIMDGSKQVGTYDLTEKGELTVHFTDPDFLKSVDQELEMFFDMIVSGDEGDDEHRFPWSGTIKDNTTVSKVADLEVQKTAEKYKAEDHSVRYTVSATVTQGMITDGKLSDKMATGMYFRDYDPGDIHVYDADGTDVTEKYRDPYINDLEAKLAAMENGEGEKTEEERQNSFELSPLPPMTQGMRFEITYESYIPDSERSNLKYVAENTVTFEGTAPDAEEHPKDTDSASMPVGGEQVEKTGSLETLEIDGKVTDVIKWTVRIGTGVGDPLVYDPLHVEDTLGSGLTFVQSDDILVQWYDKDRTVKGTRRLDWDTEVVVDGNVATYDLPESGKNKDGTDFFDHPYDWQSGDYIEVTYFTTFDPTKEPNSGFENTVKNALIVDPHGEKGRVPVGSSVQKTVVDDEKNSCLRYTIFVDVPDCESMKKQKEGKDHPGYAYFRIEDELDFDWGAFVLNVPEHVTITAEGKTSHETYTFTKVPYLSGSGDGQERETFQILQGAEGSVDAPGKSIRSFRIYFNTARYGLGADNTLNKTDSIWDINEPTRLTITYEIPYSSPVYNEDGTEAGMTLLEALSKLERPLENKAEAWFADDDMSVKTTFKKDTKEGTIDKVANILSGGQVEYRVSFVNCDYKLGEDGKFSRLIKKPGDEKKGCDILLPTLTDTFSEYMEYVEGSLRVDVYNFEGTKVYASYKYTGGKSGKDPTNGENVLTAKLYEVDDWNQMENDGHYIGKNITDTFDSQRKYVFVYKLQLKDEYRQSMTTVENIDNTALFKYGMEKLIDSTSVDIPSDMLQKDLEALGNDRLRYTLNVNTLGANLVQIETGESFVNLNSYKLVDKMSENLHLLTDKDGYLIEVMYQPEPGGEWLPLDRSASQNNISKENLNYYLGTNDDGSIFFILPDELPIKITYDVMITGAANSSELASNEATLYADETETDHRDKVFQVGESGATASGTAGVRLIKKDSATDNQLRDATFVLYSSEGPRAETISQEVAKNITVVMKDGEEVTMYPVNIYTTNDYGEILGIVPVKGREDALYALMETQAPENYILNTTPKFFYFPNQGKVGESVTFDGTDYAVENPKTDEAFIFENTRNTFELPESGGIGSTELYVLGSMLILAGLTLYFTRPRRKEDEA